MAEKLLILFISAIVTTIIFIAGMMLYAISAATVSAYGLKGIIVFILVIIVFGVVHQIIKREWAV